MFQSLIITLIIIKYGGANRDSQLINGWHTVVADCHLANHMSETTWRALWCAKNSTSQGTKTVQERRSHNSIFKSMSWIFLEKQYVHLIWLYTVFPTFFIICRHCGPNVLNAHWAVSYTGISTSHNVAPNQQSGISLLNPARWGSQWSLTVVMCPFPLSLAVSH